MKTLVISESQEQRDHITRVLKISYPKIHTISAATVEQTMTSASSDGPFGFFIIDTELKEVDPTELGLNLIDFTGDRPIIFIGAKSSHDRVSQELFETNSHNSIIESSEMNNEFTQDLNESITHALGWAKQEEFEQSLEEVDADDFIAMKIKTFYLYTKFPHDIFLAITPTTYIKIISANKPYSNSTLATYARKNVKYLYIHKDEQIKYLEAETLKCLKALRSENLTSANTYLTLLRSITILHQYVLALGVTPSVLTLANATTDKIIDFYHYKFNLTGIFFDYPVFYEGVASKSLLTAFIAESIGKAIGWEATSTKKKLAMAAILHDISLPEESMTKILSSTSPALTDYNDEQIKSFMEHTTAAAVISEQFTSFPDINFIIQNHHELPNRKGFPNKPTPSNLTQICSVFNIAQHIASQIDGKDLSQDLFIRILKGMSRDFNYGIFKETLVKAKSVLKL